MRLPFLPTDGLCRRCGRDAIALDGEYLCDDCLNYRPHFDRAASALRFEGEARELVNGFKFREKLHLRNDLVDFLEATARVRFHVEKISAVVPIPATRGHRFMRGYNQCEILAAALAKRLKKPYRHFLKRVGNPAKQGGLDEASRRTNVLNTFALSAPLVKPCVAPILLVDDIMTTGSTLSEAARMLKLSGAEKVWTISLARSIRF